MTTEIGSIKLPVVEVDHEGEPALCVGFPGAPLAVLLPTGRLFVFESAAPLFREALERELTRIWKETKR